jgi:phosphoserine phosphatase RsbU/P
MGLRGKFALALAIAAVLPLVAGFIVLQTLGFRHLLATKGRLHQAEAKTLARSLDNAVESQAGHLWSWMAADPSVPDFLAMPRPDRVADLEAVAAIEKRWLEMPPDDPLLREILRNPASDSLGRYAEKHPLVAEIFIADGAGRVVAATKKTSDYDQSDEDWWKVGTTLPEGGIWTDALHFDESASVFSLDLVIPLHLGGLLAGVVKVVLNVSTMFQRLRPMPDEDGGKLEILLSDGVILARKGEGGYEATDSRMDPESLLCVRVGRDGWTINGKGTEKEQMTGFAAIQSAVVDRQRFEPGGYILFSSPKSAVMAPLRRQVLLVGAAAGLTTGLCLLGGYALVSRRILHPIEVLSQAARALADTVRLRQENGRNDEEAETRRRVAEEDLEQIRAISTGDEVEDLAADFGVMTDKVLRYQRELEAEVEAKTAVIREELEMAREFQHALMPSGYPEFPPERVADPLRLGFAHFYQPASTVGGDFFDLIELDEHRTGVLIADVMGHGARSALVTAILRALVRNHVASAGDPGVFLGIMNRELHEVIERSHQTLFVTAFFMVLDTREARVTWAAAGHPSPLRARRGTGNPPQPLWTGARRQLALGLTAEAAYETSTTPIRSGDVFLLYTDGVVEAENPAGKDFGMQRLSATFDESLDGPLAAMPAKIICEVVSFQKRRHHDDDVCVVAVEVSPGSAPGSVAGTGILTGSAPRGA